MHFCKKNIHISNVINTFLSILLFVVHGSHSSGWRMRRALASEICSRVCLQEERKGKPASSWLISKSSDIFLYRSSFCASNSWPAFCFVLSPCSSVSRNADNPTSFARTASFRLWVKWSERSVYYIKNMDFYKNMKSMDALTGGLYSPPRAVLGTFYYGRVRFIWLLVDCWTETPLQW